MAWLSGWTKRVKLTVDQTDIDATLADFPILVYLSTASGRFDDDVSFVFDELTSDANRLKIAVTISDGTTQCYVEIEKWNDANEQAWLWVKVPSIVADVDTDLYLYYDSTHADNTAYVGDPNSTPAETVWDANFIVVSHMRDDPDNQHIRDSSTNDQDGTKGVAGAPALTAGGNIGEAQDFDGVDDFIQIADNALLDIIDELTLEAWVNIGSIDAAHQYLIAKDAENQRSYGLLVYATTGKAGIIIFNAAAGNSQQISTDALTIQAYYLAATYDYVGAANSLMNIYINGAANTAQKTDALGPINSGSANLQLGSREYTTQRQPYDGIIDEVRISNIVRSAAWLKATYETGRDDLLDFGAEETAAQIIAPAAVAVVSSVVSAAMAQYIQPAPISAGSTVQSPVLGGTGSAPISPSPVAVIGSVQAPSASGSGAVSISPLPISASSAVQAPTASATGSAPITPSPISATSTIQAPTLGGSGVANIAPSPVSASSAVQAPSIAVSAQFITPSPVVSSSVVQAPAISGSGVAAIAPNPIEATSLVQSPVLAGSGVATIALAPVAAISEVQAPRISVTQFIAPSPVGVSSSVQAPVLLGSGSAPIALSTVAAISTVQIPLIVGTGVATVALLTIGVVSAIFTPLIAGTGVASIVLLPVAAPSAIMAPQMRQFYRIYPIIGGGHIIR